MEEAPTTLDFAPVLIGGAGYAGISAARTFFNYGVDFAVLEASDRVGGRMKKLTFGKNNDTGEAYVVEEGANWVQGLDNNDVWDEVLKFGLGGILDFFEPSEYYDENGMFNLNETNFEEGTACLKNDDAVIISEELVVSCLDPRVPEEVNLTFCGSVFPDFMVSDNLDFTYRELETIANGFNPPNETDPSMARVCEYFNNADFEFAESPRVISGKGAHPLFTYSDHLDLDYAVSDPRGYEWLVQSMGAEFLNTSVNDESEKKFDDPLHLRLNTKVLRVRWDPEGRRKVVVKVCETRKRVRRNRPDRFKCIGGTKRKIRGLYFMSTFSVGVLNKTLEEEEKGTKFGKSRDVAPRFKPPLSSVPEIANGIRSYGFGPYSKIFFQFPVTFWNTTYILFANSEGEFVGDYTPVFRSADVNGTVLSGSHILQALVTGDRARELDQPNVTDEEIIDQFLTALNKLYAERLLNETIGLGRLLTREDVLDFHMPRWLQDPLFRGSFSSERFGQEGSDKEALRNTFGNLIFAGEHLCLRQTAYTHSAKRAGELQARKLLMEKFDVEDALDDLPQALMLCDTDPQDITNFTFPPTFPPTPNMTDSLPDGMNGTASNATAPDEEATPANRKSRRGRRLVDTRQLLSGVPRASNPPDYPRGTKTTRGRRRHLLPDEDFIEKQFEAAGTTRGRKQ